VIPHWARQTSSVSRAQRSMQRSAMMRCRPGTVKNSEVWDDPGSAVHRFTLHR
jgi:hypothetical protein